MSRIVGLSQSGHQTEPKTTYLSAACVHHWPGGNGQPPHCQTDTHWLSPLLMENKTFFSDSFHHAYAKAEVSQNDWFTDPAPSRGATPLEGVTTVEATTTKPDHLSVRPQW